ncbi:MAG: enoyl-CoA hydratase/isomerase family protein [Acidimicrobiia bacterium]
MLHIEDHGRVRVLRLDRPDRLNAFDNVHYGLLADAVEAAESDDAVGVVVITGAGRAFSAGADLTAIADPSLSDDFLAQFTRLLETLDASTKPLIAAVNGLAVGVGTTMLLHCDLVLADAAARFRTPFPQLGTTPEAASSILLPRLVGPQFAKWMLLTGEWVDADAALRMGLVANVYPAGTVLDEALALAERMSVLPGEALAAAKRLLAEGLTEQVRAAIDREMIAARALVAGGVPSALSPGSSPTAPPSGAAS